MKNNSIALKINLQTLARILDAKVLPRNLQHTYAEFFEKETEERFVIKSFLESIQYETKTLIYLSTQENFNKETFSFMVQKLIEFVNNEEIKNSLLFKECSVVLTLINNIKDNLYHVKKDLRNNEDFKENIHQLKLKNIKLIEILKEKF